MTDKEKARAYDEALEKARKRVATEPQDHTDAILKDIFPELRESEDERIRRKMIDHFKAKTKETWCNMPVKDIIAYLEKQKEPENTSASTMAPSCWEVEQKEQKPTEQLGGTFTSYDMAKTFTEGQNYVIAHPEKFDLCKPAEWSEDTIRKAVKEVGLTQHQIDWFKNNVFPPKPEWSEEDEKTINDACCWIAEYAGYLMDKNYGKASMLMGLTEKLKSLRPQYHGDVTMTEAYKMGLEAGKASSWKPSEEQMNALNKARRFIPYNCDILESLYNQLKKL